MALVTGFRQEVSVTGFRQFDVVDDDPSDNFYFTFLSNCADATKQSIFTTKAKFDTIMRERKQLEKYMPDSIFIRAYKCEVSLLRAAIVGVPGTPYHNFLFFFDIYLPTDYPSVPPMIHYLGFDVAGVNPKLGSSGGIYFSEIKDMGGKPSIGWDPNFSTLLQRLLAIQALVFVEKPYYTKLLHVPFAGENTRERWATEYNDKVFQRCCVLSSNILKSPPRNFEDLVAIHFRLRGLKIVRAIVARRERITLCSKEYSELVMELSNIGVPVKLFVEQVEVEKKARELVGKNEEKIIDKLLEMFSKNSIQIGSKRYFRLPSDKIDM